LKRWYHLLTMAAIIFTLSFINSSTTFADGSRISGKDRFEVGVNVSKQGWPDGSETVLLSNYNAFADALTAGPLAMKLNAPILLTHDNGITPVTKSELIRLKPKKVILIGGVGSISNVVIEQLKSELQIPTVTRIGGQNRYEVALNISKQIDSKTAFVTYGQNFADALAISPYAGKIGAPILLTDRKSLPTATKMALQNKTKAYIVGGPGSVDPSLEPLLPATSRISGKDRFEVSANIIKTFNLPTEKVYFATGLTFADALTGSVLAAREGSPLLLTHPTEVNATIHQLIAAKNITNYSILGGPASVPDKIITQLFSKLPLVGKVIVVDAGHGGSDPGAVKNGYFEKNLNFQFATKFAGKLQALGATVIKTRQDDRYISLLDRAIFANNAHPDLFISIHHDSNVSSSPRGFSLHYSSYRPAIEVKDVYVRSNGVTNYKFIREVTASKQFIVQNGSSELALSYMGDNIAYDPTPSPAAAASESLAESFAKALVYPGINLTTSYGGIRDSNLYVTRWTSMPSVLVELGFISNPDEVKLLANQTIQDSRAQALANSIGNYFSK
jgi:N-acetylmuramoyl-L-alanine amidase